MGWIIFLAWLASVAYAFRVAGGFFREDLTPRGGFEWFPVLLMTSVVSFSIGPAITVIRLIYMPIVKYVHWDIDADGVMEKIFPDPHIETKAEKTERVQREREQEIYRHRMEINAKERELGLVPTTWDNESNWRYETPW